MLYFSFYHLFNIEHSFIFYTLLFKTYRHIIVGKIGGLAEAIAVVARTGEVKLYAHHLAQSTEIPFCPLGDNVIGTIDKIELQSACLIAVGIIACSENLHPVFFAYVGSESVAIHVAIDGVG